MKKLISYVQLDGKKHLSENIFLKISKNLQKCSTKNCKNLINLTLIFSMPIFKTDVLTKNKQKKNFSILYKNKSRIFSTMKFLFQTIKKKKHSNIFYKSFYKAIMAVLKNNSFILVTKKKIQEPIFLKKHFFVYYR
jgi:ribosomal protein S7